jgi:hypothetical protein
VAAAQLGQPRHQPLRRQALGRRHAHDAGHLAVEPGQMALDRRGVGQHRLGLDQHAAGGRRHFHAVAVAVEQLGAQTALERLDATTDRRLLGIELGCSRAEAAGFCNREEETHIVPVAQNIGDFALARRRGDHRNNRYNKVVGKSLLETGFVVYLYTIMGEMSDFVSFISD